MYKIVSFITSHPIFLISYYLNLLFYPHTCLKPNQMENELHNNVIFLYLFFLVLNFHCISYCTHCKYWDLWHFDTMVWKCYCGERKFKHFDKDLVSCRYCFGMNFHLYLAILNGYIGLVRSRNFHVLSLFLGSSPLYRTNIFYS